VHQHFGAVGLGRQHLLAQVDRALDLAAARGDQRQPVARRPVPRLAGEDAFEAGLRGVQVAALEIVEAAAPQALDTGFHKNQV